MEFYSKLKRQFRQHPVKRQVISIFLVAVLGLSVFASIIFYTNLAKIEDIAKQRGEDKAELLTILSIDALITKDRPALKTIISGIHSHEPGLIAMRVIDVKGDEIAGWKRDTTAKEKSLHKVLFTSQPIVYYEQDFGTLEMSWTISISPPLSNRDCGKQCGSSCLFR